MKETNKEIIENIVNALYEIFDERDIERIVIDVGVDYKDVFKRRIIKITIEL